MGAQNLYRKTRAAIAAVTWAHTPELVDRLGDRAAWFIAKGVLPSVVARYLHAGVVTDSDSVKDARWWMYANAPTETASPWITAGFGTRSEVGVACAGVPVDLYQRLLGVAPVDEYAFWCTLGLNAEDAIMLVLHVGQRAVRGALAHGRTPTQIVASAKAAIACGAPDSKAWVPMPAEQVEDWVQILGQFTFPYSPASAVVSAFALHHLTPEVGRRYLRACASPASFADFDFSISGLILRALRVPAEGEQGAVRVDALSKMLQLRIGPDALTRFKEQPVEQLEKHVNRYVAANPKAAHVVGFIEWAHQKHLI